MTRRYNLGEGERRDEWRTDATMSVRHVGRAITVAGAALLLVSGCAPMSEQQLCEMDGGIYVAQSRTCDESAVREIERRRCEARGMVYWPAQRYCERQSGI